MEEINAPEENKSNMHFNQTLQSILNNDKNLMEKMQENSESTQSKQKLVEGLKYLVILSI